jgi:Flp pilus assembly protein TadD
MRGGKRAINWGMLYVLKLPKSVGDQVDALFRFIHAKREQALIGRIISLKVLALNEMQKSLREQLEQARKTCADLLRENPTDLSALVGQGLVKFQMGRTEEAEAWMETALMLAPESVDVTYGYGTIRMSQRKYALALPLMQRVIALKPNHAKAHHCIAIALMETGDLVGALAAFVKSLKINQLDSDVFNDMGNLLKDMGRLSEAAVCYEQALLLKPDNHLAMNNLGVVRFLQNDLDSAETLHKSALAVQSDYPEALSNLATVRRLKGDVNGAISFCQKALALRQDYPEALNNLGNALRDARRLDEAVVTYENAVRLRPEDADFHLNLSMAMLALGRFEEGWREYKWRWKSRQLSPALQAFSKPEWQGEAGEGRVLLIHSEQGFGDTLQFCRYAPMARERGFHVVMRVQRPVARLLQSLNGVEKVVADGDALPSFDLHCPMMSLPFALRTTVETIPAELPYLSPNPADVNRWGRRMAALADGALRVGLVWAGSLRTRSPDLIATDRDRSVAPETIASLMEVQGVRFFSLQKDGSRAPYSFHVIDWMADCHDFADTAALIMNLDLVIGVDTAAVHLAGALDKPFWLLNRFNSCWRWLVERDDSPWYPGTLRLFGQKELGNWDEVVARVRDALAEKVSEVSPPPTNG